MTDPYKIAIVGAGPGGLSAAAQAAELGVSHILLEASPQIAQTVRRFQKGKLVMAEPARLPLRSALRFSPGQREAILSNWQEDVTRHRVNLRLGASITGISGHRGAFTLTLGRGDPVQAEHVVLAIGLQGNLRKLGIPGDDHPLVQYQLDDPNEYREETIIVVGGGDAGVENALALVARNRVILLNRQDEFSNCRESNLDRLKEAVRSGMLETRTNTRCVAIEHATGGFPLVLTIQSPHGMERLSGHRIIARLGAEPPRQLLESFGIRFPTKDTAAIPQLSETYESNLSGIHIIGSLAGYPLIKQALNQGYEVIEYILGRPVNPADQPLLEHKFSKVPGLAGVEYCIALLRQTQPLLASLTNLQLREFMLDSEILVPRPDEVIFKRNDYSNSFYSILRGGVAIHIERADGHSASFNLGPGDFFGEIGLLSGRRRSGTAVAGTDCILVETPRRSMLRLLDAVPGVQRRLDEVSLKRIVKNCYGNALPDHDVDHLVQDARMKSCAVGDIVFREGEMADALYLIRRGSVTVSQRQGNREVILAYVSAGNYVGEMALVSQMPRSATVTAAAPTELVMLDATRFSTILDANPAMRSEVSSRYLQRIRANEAATQSRDSEMIQFLMDQGVGEATDLLLIDYGKCIRCDNCEKACADAHLGATRLNRKAGQTFAHLHVPASCRHCEHPRCMKDCPPDAIHRSATGEVFITDSCIGCGQCQSNCPYGVIQMADVVTYQRPSLWQLITGLQGKTAASVPALSDTPAARHAVKCDMCRDVIGGAACVRACPTNAAFRVSPEQFLAMSGS